MAADPQPDPLAGYEDWGVWASRQPRLVGDDLADGLSAVLGIPEPTLVGAPRIVVERQLGDVVERQLEWSTGFGPPTIGWLVRPVGDEKLPGVLAFHCHGGVKSIGAEQLIDLGVAAAPEARVMQNAYYGGRAPAVELARRGFVVLAGDAFCWGSRRFPLIERTAKLESAMAGVEALWRETGIEVDDAARYNALAGIHEDTVAKGAGVYGTSLAGTVAADDLVALEVLLNQPGVDPTRIGCFGFSGGGGRAVLIGALDPRIRGQVVTCMMATFASLTPRYLDTHSWLLNSPGLARFSEWPALVRANQERSVLVQYGERDPLFPPGGMRDAHEALTDRVGGSYTGSFHDRGHEFDAGMQDEAFEFLAEALAR